MSYIPVGLKKGIGAVIASATSITPTHTIHSVTGNTEIDTIVATNAIVGDSVNLIMDGWFTGTGGNIGAAAGAPTAGFVLVFIYNGTVWNPSAGAGI